MRLDSPAAQAIIGEEIQLNVKPRRVAVFPLTTTWANSRALVLQFRQAWSSVVERIGEVEPSGHQLRLCRRRRWRRASRILWLGPPDVDRTRVDHVLQMGSVVLLDHLNAGAAVLGKLIDVRAIEKPEADIGMPQAVRATASPVPIELEIELVEDLVQQVVLAYRKQTVGGL